MIGGLLAPAAASFLQGTEPPTRLQIEQYRRDGTLHERIRAAKELGNHRVAPGLAERAVSRLKRLTDPTSSPSTTQLTPPGTTDMPTKGAVKILVLLIDFSDYPHNETRNAQAKVQARIFGDGDSAALAPYESLRNFYSRSSYGQLDLTGNVLGWYRPSSTRASISQTTAGRQNLIKEALEYYNGIGHDFTQYDNNGDGKIDYFAVIWSGPDNGWGNFWWGYQTGWNSTTTPLTLDGKTLRNYSWQWESNPVNGNFVPKTLIHETGHGLGLPDYYDYLTKADGDTVGPDGGVGGLDMMDAAIGDHNCFSKFLLDWITPSVYTAAANGVALRAAGSFGDAAIIMPDATAGNNFGEFFMVQNRKRVQNDSSYPADGLLIWHVDSRLNPGLTDFIYDNSWTEHKLLRLMEADGLEQIEQDLSANAGDYWINGKTFGPQGIPNSSRYNGLWTNMGVTAISVPGDTMSFDVFTLPPDATPPSGTPTTPTIGTSPTTSGTLAYQWTAGTAADAESGIAAYHLQVGTSPGAADFFDSLVGKATGRTFTNAGQDGRTYYARVRAMNGAGLYSAWSGASSGIQVVFPVFPCATLDACTLAFKTRGDAPWTSQSSVVHGTASAAQSPTLGNLSDCVLQTSVVGPGTFSFWWKVSSEAGYDFLTFSIDGVAQAGRISGEADWAQKTYSIPAGTHLLKWSYAKDESATEGQDRAWVDQVSYTATQPSGPTITTQPQSQTVTVGQAATFSVAATGTGTLSYQWKKGATDVGTNAPSYTTPATILADSGSQFSVVVTDSNGSTPSSSATLTVTPVVTGPTITSQPASQTVSAGQTATFTVAATGTGSLGYQWFRNGAAITGATATSYVTPPTTVAANHGDQYRVTVTDSTSSTGSNTATLTVTACGGGSSQQLLQSPGFEGTNAGVWFTSTTQANNSVIDPANDPALAHTGTMYAWLCGWATPTTESVYQTVTIPAGSTSALLSFWLLIATDEDGTAANDTLKVQVRNGSGALLDTLTTYSNINANTNYQQKNFNLINYAGQTIRVHFEGQENASAYTSFLLDDISVTVVAGSTATAPAFTAHPASQSASAGGSATFTATATGTAPLTYQWRRNGVGIPGANGTSLTLTGLQAADNGAVIDCQAGNCAGMATSNPATLTVSSITVSVSPKTATLLAGSSQAFTASVAGTGNTAVTWSGTGAGFLSSLSANTTTFTASTAGSYVVTATSAADTSKSDSATITVRTRDLNGDGSTDVLDLASFARAHGSTSASSNWNAACDLNGDGSVDDTDIALFLAGF